MRLNRIKLEHFFVKIALTRGQEADCDECAQLSAQLVEAVLTGDVQSAELERILLHLKQCIPCAEEFAVLHECARMEVEDTWPSTEELHKRLANPPPSETAPEA